METEEKQESRNFACHLLKFTGKQTATRNQCRLLTFSKLMRERSPPPRDRVSHHRTTHRVSTVPGSEIPLAHQ
ncbi:Hypothetical predicted protein [Podarcis lilfordi]|uniref:Uncharacterized protein n=1 Tax=Podarcis lilfordi TaxID=74358 RepID=A0AA35K938_9SAUR|nr:Hypothetical predicted protein [Podarcis lilfordi]